MEVDARGIIAPEAGLSRFRLDRYPPSPPVARFVDRYWVVTWDLTGQAPYVQRVFAHPVVNVVLGDGRPTVVGVTSRISSRTLRDSGRVLGIMFRPAGFRPFLGRPLSSITDKAGLSVRQLQRRFGDHVGVSPKAVVRRYRLYEAAERARSGREVDWAVLAAELGHSDQAHLTRDFSATVDMPPDRYARTRGLGR
ncbi:MAG TPA: DUF6597 domain-containing transcriptional factor [Acidimicrobiales bacterium]|nr:DUF6597 domain-containing transcriptional factor [Acidimicrobiales bacterium]